MFFFLTLSHSFSLMAFPSPPSPPIYYLLSLFSYLLSTTQVYDDSGYPKYHDQFNERDYSDLPFTERPRYNVQQYPDHRTTEEQQAEFVKDRAPA